MNNNNKKKGTAGNLEPKNGMVEDYVVSQQYW